MKEKKTELVARAYFVVIVFSIIAMVIAYKVVKISVVEGDKWRQKGGVNVQWMELDADRGNIYADDESILVTSMQLYEVRMDMKVLNDKVFYEKVDSLALMLSTTIRTDKTKSTWKNELIAAKKKGKPYFFIAKDLDIEDLRMVRKFPIFRYGRYGSGYIETRYGRRVKPLKELASRTIGEDRDNAQKVGLEGYYDRFLKGPVDKRLMKKVSATEDIWVPIYDPSENNLLKGDDVITTLNVHLQDIVHSEVENAMIKYNAKMATAILMEVETGAIKAITNLGVNEQGLMREYYNIGVASSTEPGSTFKLATALALLEDGKATPETTVNLNGGTLKFSDRIMHDSEKHNKFVVTLKEAFAISSNVGLASLANQAYNQNLEGRKMFRDRLTTFGLDALTGIDLEGEGKPKIKDPVLQKNDWYGTTIPWMAHGYEVAITPLQMLNFYNAVANGGKLMKPYLVSEIRSENGKSIHFKPTVLKESIAKPENIRAAQAMLEEVVLTGTAKSIKSEEFSFAGKTGTTRINYANKDEFKKYNASFAGYFPADKPKYSLIVVVYEPQGVFYGSLVAAPIFKSIAEKTLAWGRMEDIASVDPALTDSLAMAQAKRNNVVGSVSGYAGDFITLFDYVGMAYKVKSKQQWALVNPLEHKMILNGKKISKGKIPDVRGMGPRDAVYILESLGLGVLVQGSGKVVRQSILPGTTANGQKVEIYLN